MAAKAQSISLLWPHKFSFTEEAMGFFTGWISSPGTLHVDSGRFLYLCSSPQSHSFIMLYKFVPIHKHFSREETYQRGYIIIMGVIKFLIAIGPKVRVQLPQNHKPSMKAEDSYNLLCFLWQFGASDFWAVTSGLPLFYSLSLASLECLFLNTWWNRRELFPSCLQTAVIVCIQF